MSLQSTFSRLVESCDRAGRAIDNRDWCQDSEADAVYARRANALNDLGYFVLANRAAITIAEPHTAAPFCEHGHGPMVQHRADNRWRYYSCDTCGLETLMPATYTADSAKTIVISDGD